MELVWNKSFIDIEGQISKPVKSALLNIPSKLLKYSTVVDIMSTIFGTLERVR